MSSDSASNSSAVQPIKPENFVKANVRIEPCQWSTFGDSKTPYGRANIKYATTTADGKTVLQPLILLGPPMNTYGVGDNIDEKSKEITGHSVCFNLPKADPVKGACAFEKALLDIHQVSCEYLCQNAQGCGLDPSVVDTPQSARVLLKCPAEYPKNKETKKVETNKPRRMYAKLEEYKASGTRPGKMVTIFDDATSYNPTTGRMERELDPLTVRTNVELIPSIHITSIYVGSKPSLQLKLVRAAVTRLIEANNVAACDDYVKGYLETMGLTPSAGGLAAEAAAASSDPAAML